MIELVSSINNKSVWISAAFIITIYPGTTGTEILTLPGVVYRVKESPEEVLSLWTAATTETHLEE